MKSHIVVGVLVGFLLGFTDGAFGKWIGLSVLFSYWPDIDAVIHFIRLRVSFGSWKKAYRVATGKWAHEHRNILHIPLLIIPVTAGFLWLFDWQVASLFAGLSVTHFLIDSGGIGWGIRWVYPLSTRQWKFHEGTLQSWTPEELKDVVELEGDENWFSNRA